MMHRSLLCQNSVPPTTLRGFGTRTFWRGGAAEPRCCARRFRRRCAATTLRGRSEREVEDLEMYVLASSDLDQQGQLLDGLADRHLIRHHHDSRASIAGQARALRARRRCRSSAVG